MVRSHALYPIELRAHRGEIVSSNYNGNKIISAKLNRCNAPGQDPRPVRPRSHFALNPARAVEIGGLGEIEESTRFVN
jgi:hypothetical protein